MGRRRRARAVVAILGTILVAFALFVALLDLSWFRGPLEALASSQLKREVEIGGDIDGGLSLTPRFSLRDVRIANAPWGSRPRMLTLDRVTFEIDLLELLGSRLVLPMVALEAPDVLIERSGDGRINWQLGGGTDQAGAMPAIGEVSVRDARIRYRGPEARHEIMAALETLSGTGGMASEPITLHGSGALANLPLELDFEAGALNALKGGGKPYPVDLTLDIGTTAAAIRGTLREPMSLQAAHLDLRLESPDPAPLLAAADLGQAPAPPLWLFGRLVHEYQLWSVLDLQVRVGESTLSGRAGVDFAKRPPLITADFDSQRLDIQALRDVYARIAPAFASDEEQEVRPIWTAQQGLNIDLLPDLQLDVALDAKDVTARDLQLIELHLDGMLRDKVPRLQLSTQGRYRGESLMVEATAGTDGPEPGPYRLDGRLEVGANRANLSGSMNEPLALTGLDVAFDLKSPRPESLFELLGLPAPQIQGLMLSGDLEHDGALWRLNDFAARLGESDIGGRMGIDFAGKTPSVRAELRSSNIEVADLLRLMGPRTEAVGEEAAKEAAEELPVPEPAAGPDEPMITPNGVNRPALPDWQVQLDYTLERLRGPELNVQNARLLGSLRNQVVAAALTGGGEIKGEPLRFDLRVGRLEEGQMLEGGYPIDAHLEAGETTADLSGGLGEAMSFREATVSFKLAGPNPGQWLALTRLPAPKISQVRAAGELIRDGDRWRLPEVYLEVGESNLFGSGSLDLARERPLLTADLRSNRLLARDLMPALEAGEQQEMPEQPPPVSAQGINLEGLPEVDADLTLAAEYVRTAEDVVFERLAADLQLRNRIVVVDLTAEGKYGQSPLTVEAQLGAPENLDDPSARYPVEVRLASDMSTANVSGSVADPRTFTDLNIDVLLEGPDLNGLGTILQLGLPTTPPYRLAGNLTHDGARWRLGSLDGRIGDSDIHGVTTIDLSANRPLIAAELRSNRLDFDDLGVLVGEPPQVAPGETASTAQRRAAAREATSRRVLPDKKFDLPDLRAVDARVHYVAEAVRAGRLPIERMTLGVALQEGLLRIDPLRFAAGQGTVATNMKLNARENPIDAEIDLRVRELNLSALLKQLDIDLPQFEGEDEGRGTIGGRAELETRGNSVAEMAGSLGGQLSLFMDGGRINGLLMEAAGLDIYEILGLLVTGREMDMVPIRCLVADVPVSKGIARFHPLVLDTTDSNVVGAGTIDLGSETLDLRVAAFPKDVSLLSANVTIEVSGSFSEVDIRPMAEEITEKGLMDFGLARDNNCQALMASARQKLLQEAERQAEER
jgi:AsmA family protein